MASPFCTLLGVDVFESRVTPSASPTAPHASYAEADTANVAVASPYVFLDISALDKNHDGANDNVTQLSVTVTTEDGRTVTVTVNVRPGQDTTSIAGQIASALQAEGVDATANGSSLTIRGRDGSPVEDVKVQTTGSTLGADNPNVGVVVVDAQNGATASSTKNLPRSQAQ